MTLKDVIDTVSTLGALGFALLAVYAFFTNRLHSDAELKERLADRDRQIEEQKMEKREAFALARESIASTDRLSDAIEARNRLEEARERVELEEAQRRPRR